MKVHLYDSSDPLKEGEDYTARCSSLVKSARFVLVIDTSYDGSVFESMLTCVHCVRAGVRRRYLYGMVNGEEAKQAKDS